MRPSRQSTCTVCTHLPARLHAHTHTHTHLPPLQPVLGCTRPRPDAAVSRRIVVVIAGVRAILGGGRRPLVDDGPARCRHCWRAELGDHFTLNLFPQGQPGGADAVPTERERCGRFSRYFFRPCWVVCFWNARRTDRQTNGPMISCHARGRTYTAGDCEGRSSNTRSIAAAGSRSIMGAAVSALQFVSWRGFEGELTGLRKRCDRFFKLQSVAY